MDDIGDSSIGTSTLDLVACSLVGIEAMLVVAIGLITPSAPPGAEGVPAARNDSIEVLNARVVVELNCPIVGLQGRIAAGDWSKSYYLPGAAYAKTEAVLISRGVESRELREAFGALFCKTDLSQGDKGSVLPYQGSSLVIEVQNEKYDKFSVEWQPRASELPGRKGFSTGNRQVVCAALLEKKPFPGACAEVWKAVEDYQSAKDEHQLQKGLIRIHERLVNGKGLQAMVMDAARAPADACVRLITPDGVMTQKVQGENAAKGEGRMDPTIIPHKECIG